MSNAKRKDANTDEIMIAILEAGWRYIDTHDSGHGFPDCIAYKIVRGMPVSVLIEIKTRIGKLTSAEKIFHERHDGLVYICRTGEDVKRILNDYERKVKVSAK
jgi:hypothetical protein